MRSRSALFISDVLIGFTWLIRSCGFCHSAVCRFSHSLLQPSSLPVLLDACSCGEASNNCLQDLKMVKQLGHPISWEDMFYLRWSHRYKPHQIQSEQVLGVAGIARDERKGAARAAFK